MLELTALRLDVPCSRLTLGARALDLGTTFRGKVYRRGPEESEQAARMKTSNVRPVDHLTERAPDAPTP